MPNSKVFKYPLCIILCMCSFSSSAQTVIDDSANKLSKRQMSALMSFSAKSFKYPDKISYRYLYVSKGKFVCGQSRFVNLLGQDEGFQEFYMDISKEDGLRASAYRDKFANDHFVEKIQEKCGG